MKTAIVELQAKVADFISGKVATAGAALTEFQTRLSSLDATVTNELTQAQADLITAQASIKSLGAEKEKLTSDLAASNLSLEASNSA
ncbi:hypothetical protein ACSTLM_00275, partial [Vibrio parahaemolyticus]